LVGSLAHKLSNSLLIPFSQGITPRIKRRGWGALNGRERERERERGVNVEDDLFQTVYWLSASSTLEHGTSTMQNFCGGHNTIRDKCRWLWLGLRVSWNLDRSLSTWFP
jgi:hypothetical protein